jgi:hypothetical protein
MVQTVEMRWFFPTEPFPVSELFNVSVRPVGRTDWYAYPCNERCGIKTRQGQLETKLLVQRLGRRDFGDVVGTLEEWAKWSVPFPQDDVPADRILASTGWVAVEKVRHLRRFEVVGGSVREVDQRPENGCELEWTALRVAGQMWWTVGLEAVGPHDELEANLRLTAARVLAGKFSPSPFEEKRSFAYPKWLKMVKDEGRRTKDEGRGTNA